DSEWAVVALDPSTGAINWEDHYHPATGVNLAGAVVASSDGRHVYVAGRTADPSNQATIAYAASDGSRLWVATETPPPGYQESVAFGTQGGAVLALTPDDTTLFTAGSTEP